MYVLVSFTTTLRCRSPITWVSFIPTKVSCVFVIDCFFLSHLRWKFHFLYKQQHNYSIHLPYKARALDSNQIFLESFPFNWIVEHQRFEEKRQTFNSNREKDRRVFNYLPVSFTFLFYLNAEIVKSRLRDWRFIVAWSLIFPICVIIDYSRLIYWFEVKNTIFFLFKFLWFYVCMCNERLCN